MGYRKLLGFAKTHYLFVKPETNQCCLNTYESSNDLIELVIKKIFGDCKNYSSDIVSKIQEKVRSIVIPEYGYKVRKISSEEIWHLNNISDFLNDSNARNKLILKADDTIYECDITDVLRNANLYKIQLDKELSKVTTFFYSALYSIISRESAKDFFEKCFDKQLEQTYKETTSQTNLVTGKNEVLTYSHLALKKHDLLKEVREKIIEILTSDWSNTLAFEEFGKFSQPHSRYNFGIHNEEIYQGRAKEIKYGVKIISFLGEERDLFSTFIKKVLLGT